MASYGFSPVGSTLGDSEHNTQRTTMKLKTITLIAAIAQLLALVCGIFNFAHLIQKLTWADNAQLLVMQPIYLAAQIALVVFLFVLFARQQPN